MKGVKKSSMINFLSPEFVVVVTVGALVLASPQRLECFLPTALFSRMSGFLRCLRDAIGEGQRTRVQSTTGSSVNPRGKRTTSTTTGSSSLTRRLSVPLFHLVLAIHRYGNGSLTRPFEVRLWTAARPGERPSCLA